MLDIQTDTPPGPLPGVAGFACNEADRMNGSATSAQSASKKRSAVAEKRAMIT